MAGAGVEAVGEWGNEVDHLEGEVAVGQDPGLDDTVQFFEGGGEVAEGGPACCFEDGTALLSLEESVDVVVLCQTHAFNAAAVGTNTAGSFTVHSCVLPSRGVDGSGCEVLQAGRYVFASDLQVDSGRWIVVGVVVFQHVRSGRRNCIS